MASSPSKVPTAPPTAVPPTAIPPTAIPPTAEPTAAPLTQRLERSIRDNRDAVKSGLSLEGLSVAFDPAAHIVVLTVKPKKPSTLPGYLTNGSALAVVAGKAIWGAYPEVAAIDIYVQGETLTGDSSRLELITMARYRHEDWVGRDYGPVAGQYAKDNKYMFCEASLYDVHIRLYESLRDKGCLKVRTKLQAATAGFVRPVYAQLPGVGRKISLAKDGWDLTVARIARRQTVPGETALGTYVVVEVAMANTSKRTQSLCGDRFKIVDDRDREYPYYDVGTAMYGAGELCSRINAGLSATAVLLFDLPTDATGLILKSLGDFRVALGDVGAIRLER